MANPTRKAVLSAADAAVQRILTRCSVDPAYFIFGGHEVGGFIRTKDEHDYKNSRKPFPQKNYLKWLLDEIHTGGQMLLIAKSRQLMVSWLVAAYALWHAMFRPDSLVLWQTKKLEDAAAFIYEHSLSQARISLMLSQLPDWMQICAMPSGEFYPLGKLEQYCSYARVALPNGSQILGLAQGASQVEGRVPSLFIPDEASLQDEWESAISAAKPAIERDSKIISIGTMRLPSAFGNAISPSWDVDHDQCGRGMARFRSPDNIPGVRVHYTADPDKDPETEVGAAWYKAQQESGAYPGGRKGWQWQQHMEINPLSRAGTLVLPTMRDLLPKIVIQDLSPHDTFGWSFDAGFDWGTLNRTVFVVFGMSPEGDRVLLWEMSQPASELGGIPGVAAMMKRCPWFEKVNGSSIWADPSIWNTDQNTDGGLVDKAQIFQQYGVYLNKALAKGQHADDVLINRINHHYWADPEDIRLYICENAAWTLKHLPALIFEEWSESQRELKEAKEKIRGLHVDEWDAIKYAEVAWTDIPRHIITTEPGTYAHAKRVHGHGFGSSVESRKGNLR